jgi:hypothetical protein
MFHAMPACTVSHESIAGQRLALWYTLGRRTHTISLNFSICGYNDRVGLIHILDGPAFLA